MGGSKILYQKSFTVGSAVAYQRRPARTHTLTHTLCVLAVPFPLASLKEDSKWGLRQARNPVKSF